jgi:hypothetical protein
MELLPEADSVVRQFIACVMDAAGLKREAAHIRKLPPVQCQRSLVQAARSLARARSKGVKPGPWKQIVEDTLFFGSAALWAALRGDEAAFNECSDRMHQSIKGSGLEQHIH